MLARKYKIKNAEDFDKVKRHGKLYQFKMFAVAILKREEDGDVSRYGFVISKKISNLSTKRNRLRRILDDAVRYNVTRTKDGHDVVFLAKKTMNRSYTDDIMKEVDKALKKIGLVK